MIHSVTVFRGTYVDSVVQLSGTRALRAVDGVDWAAAAMATPGNRETLAAEGFAADEVADAGANDLVIAVRAASDDAVAQAREAGEAALFSARGSDGAAPAEQLPRTLAEAVSRAPESNVAVVSVPGDYAALEAHKALSAGLDVLLFSDNVPVAAEVALKNRAARMGRLVMGPGAGTAMLGHTCLGFANVVAGREGQEGRSVAVVAAAGTGAQEAAALLDRWGVGVSHVIGLGGRDLTAAVGGRMALTALGGLLADERTDVVLLVSKPPDPEVAQQVLAAAAGKPLVAALIGLDGDGIDVPDGVVVTRTLEAGVVAAVAAVGKIAPDPADGLAELVRAHIEGLPATRTLVRGLFSGGTLCYESLVLLADVLGPVHSNTPIDKALGLPAPPHAHTCLDLGEEEYTKGRPHPMIDPEARIELLRTTGAEPDVAAIILDVVLGYGAHADPAAELGPVCAEITAGSVDARSAGAPRGVDARSADAPRGVDARSAGAPRGVDARSAGAPRGGPVVVVYVLGTDGDPQGLERQRRAFTEAGCLVTATAARASLAAAAVARRDPGIAAVPL